MTTLDQLETALGLTLPAGYKGLLERYPAKLLAHDGTGIYRRYSQGYLLRDPGELHQVNTRIRRKLASWPARFFIIGLDRVESYFVLDLERTDTAVYPVGDEDYAFERDEHISLAALQELCGDPWDSVEAFIAQHFEALEGKPLE